MQVCMASKNTACSLRNILLLFLTTIQEHFDRDQQQLL
jgi:hypothetical protein